MKSVVIALTLIASILASKGDGNISDDPSELITFEPEPGVPLSFYTGIQEDGTPVKDASTDDDFPEDFFPRIPSSLGIDALRKPLNEDRIRAMDQWADKSDDSEESWSSEFVPSRETSFYTGEGAKDTLEVPLNPNSPDMQALEKKPEQTNTLEPKSHLDKL